MLRAKKALPLLEKKKVKLEADFVEIKDFLKRSNQAKDELGIKLGNYWHETVLVELLDVKSKIGKANAVLERRNSTSSPQPKKQ